jgi:glycosyltransferase involved in cell wall biosynthesis
MGRPRQQPTILIVSQVYVPDPTSLGQHMADAAEALAARGYHVRVLTSARGYDDPTIKYPRRETRGGVEIVRLPLSSFGKRTIPLRLLGAGLFLLQAIVRGWLTGRLAAVLVSTSPPMCSVAALLIAGLRRVPVKYWVMDQNPDQVIALGRITENGIAARCFNWLNRRILARADDVVVLDRFMAERVCQKRDVTEKLTILPPWPHEDVLETVPRDQNPFIKRHGLQEKLVVMYSGNHSIASPLTTLLDAALQLQGDPRFCFMFIGGGLGKQEVDQMIATRRPANMVSLPYQPLADIKYSLSAADLHVVTLGESMVGIVHPCKIYGAMSVGRPILAFGPAPSHVSDLIDAYQIGWQIGHGDVDTTLERLRAVARMERRELLAIGAAGRTAVRTALSKTSLCGALCDVVERGLPRGTTETVADRRATGDKTETAVARSTVVSETPVAKASSD